MDLNKIIFGKYPVPDAVRFLLRLRERLLKKQSTRRVHPMSRFAAKRHPQFAKRTNFSVTLVEDAIQKPLLGCGHVPAF